MSRFLLLSLAALLGMFPLPAGKDSIREIVIPLPEFEKTASSQDRCCNAGCMVEVSTTKPPMVVKTSESTTLLSVYFEEDSSVLSTHSIGKIEKLLKDNPQLKNITVVGTTDGCGSPTHNVRLSSRRAKSVKNIISRRRVANIDVRWSGEVTSGHSSKARRVDIMATETVKLMAPPPKIIADFYLIDGSGSMKGGDWQRYVRSISYHRPRNSRVFVSSTSCMSRGKNLASIDPVGGTEIWYSYWSILDHMSAGESLVIISDFNSTVPLRPRERTIIENKVSEAGVKVRSIYP